MANFAQRLRELRTARGLSLQEFAKIIKMSKSSVFMWESGEREPKLEKLEEIADFFNVDMNYLHGKSDIPNEILALAAGGAYDNIFPIRTRKIPLLGDIACGEPIFADEQLECYVETTTDIRADFCLRAKGDSMINARINDGDIVFIRRQPDVDNGEIAAVIIDDEATLKRVYKTADSVSFVAENPKFPPMVFTEASAVNVRILGKAIAFQSDVK